MPRYFLLTLLLLPTVAAAQDRPLPPKDASKAMTLPPGFRATLFAGEPDVVQPIAFAFDDRGRLWVVECLSYPKWRNDRTGHDRVVIFEDTDGDGRFDKKTVFWDKGSNLSGIELGFGGVWLCSTPDLIFIPVENDKPAGPPQVILDGFDLTARHNVFNSLTWGPDGWLYGCNGILSNSKIGKPGTPDAKRVAMNCGVWRYHPVRKEIEDFADGTTNPWGLDFNEEGEMFITNCVIHHVWHVVPGARFQRMFGQDVHPHTYALMPSIADHLHWGGGDWTSSRGGKGVHDAPGGGHAHSGCMVYLGDNWPDEYRGNVFMCNIHGNRINRDALERKGSTYVAKHRPDFMFANDPWFRGIAIKYGPDGGVYVCDWTDTGECHNYEKVDQTNGRIYKITYGDVRPWKGDLTKLSDQDLVKLHTHKNEWFVNHARRILQERAAAGKVDPKAVSLLEQMLGRWSVRAVWTLAAIGRWNPREGLEKGGSLFANEAFQAWAIRLYMDLRRNDMSQWPMYRRLFDFGGLPQRVLVDSTPRNALAVLSGLQWWEPEKRRVLLTDIIFAADRRAKEPNLPLEDPYLPLMYWYAVEPTVVHDTTCSILTWFDTRWPVVRELVARRIAEKDITKFDWGWLEWNANSPDAVDVLRGVQHGLAGRKQVAPPENWPDALRALSASPNAEVRDRALQLAVLFGDKTALAKLMATVSETQAVPAKRITALELLVQRQSPELLPVLRSLLDEPALRAAAMRGLASYNASDTPELILKRYARLSESEKSDAVQTLASRPAYALALLDAVEKGPVARTDISPVIARQILSLKNKQLSEKLAKVWGTIRPASKDRPALTAKYKAILTPDALKTADAAKGKLVFAKTCASCHKLYGEGGAIGPDLTGAQRTNLDYILENVLDPSAVVAREYQVVIVELRSGRTLNGIIKSETDRAITVQTQNEAVIVAKGDIESRTQTNVSMMPEGLFEKLTNNEVRDLVAYLMGPTRK